VVMGSRLRFFELLRLMGLLEDYRAMNKHLNFEEYLPEHKDFVISIQESEEEDEIVSHYLKMDITMGQNDTEHISNESTYRELLEDAWSSELRDRLGSEQMKIREDLVKLESNLMKIKSTVEITASEMNNTEEDLEDNLIALQKLQDTGDESEETLSNIKKLESFSNILKETLIEKEKAHMIAIEEYEKLEHTAHISRRKLEKEEDMLRKLEVAESLEASTRANSEKATMDLVKIQEKVDTIQGLIRGQKGENGELLDRLAAAMHEKKTLETVKEKAEEIHRNAVKDLVAYKQHINERSDTDMDFDGSVSQFRRAKIRRRHRRDEDEDDELLDDEDTDSENDDDNQLDGPINNAAVSRLKKKIKKQKVLIKMLKNQITSTGQKPIEELITYEKAEENLKNALSRLLMGDEAASDEYDKWDHFVRSHPRYKQQEDDKFEKWKQENEALNNTCLRIFKSIVPADIVSHCTLATLEDQLPKSVARRIWMKKALWMTRLSKDHISKLHVADLQTKYSCQGLDEMELRAVWACLPGRFDNDNKGDKEAWKLSVFEALKVKREILPWAESMGDGGPSKIILDKYISAIDRNVAYREMTGLIGPFDPDSSFVQLEQSSHTDIVIDDVRSRQPRSLLGDKVTADGKYNPTPPTPPPQKIIGSLFANAAVDGLAASTGVVTPRVKKAGGPGTPKMGPNFLQELKMKSQLRKK